jgi:hypothetical protein
MILSWSAIDTSLFVCIARVQRQTAQLEGSVESLLRGSTMPSFLEIRRVGF